MTWTACSKNRKHSPSPSGGRNPPLHSGRNRCCPNLLTGMWCVMRRPGTSQLSRMVPKMSE